MGQTTDSMKRNSLMLKNVILQIFTKTDNFAKWWHVPCHLVPCCTSARGDTYLERGYGDVRPWRPPFHASPVVHKGPISSNSQFTSPPFEKKMGKFSLYSLNCCPNLNSQAPKFGNFQFTRPLFQRQWSVHNPPPPTSEIRAAHPYLKKSWVPPPPPGTSVIIISTYSLVWDRKD